MGRSSQFCRVSDSHLWSDVARDQLSTVLFAKFAQGQHGKSIFEQLHSNENMKVIHIHLRFFIRLDLTIGCDHCYGIAGLVDGELPERCEKPQILGRICDMAL